ncbi:uncharacterized protein TM35_000012150 [Trypanosoma theileri]|uniref:Transmembrane protein n=1 Tax=Trypanosoma theileri TaxID=67003 RepID=A0A1X0P8Y2_9TRYP|nr:uncharacterized protein TM35_000012150 [Trypanosoma theileri]ORC93338.1 hypothetical protein TM35_000012150 [Trypanosoma theileri]
MKNEIQMNGNSDSSGTEAMELYPIKSKESGMFTNTSTNSSEKIKAEAGYMEEYNNKEDVNNSSSSSRSNSSNVSESYEYYHHVPLFSDNTDVDYFVGRSVPLLQPQQLHSSLSLAPHNLSHSQQHYADILGNVTTQHARLSDVNWMNKKTTENTAASVIHPEVEIVEEEEEGLKRERNVSSILNRKDDNGNNYNDSNNNRRKKSDYDTMMETATSERVFTREEMATIIAQLRIVACSDVVSSPILGNNKQSTHRFRCPCCRQFLKLLLTQTNENCLDRIEDNDDDEGDTTADEGEEEEQEQQQYDDYNDYERLGGNSTMEGIASYTRERSTRVLHDPIMRRILQFPRRESTSYTHPSASVNSVHYRRSHPRFNADDSLSSLIQTPVTIQEETPQREGGDVSFFPALPSFSATSFVRAYVGEGNSPWEATLHTRPAIIVCSCVAAMNLVVVQFLQQHVLDTRDHIGLFIVGTYMILASYYMAYYFLGRCSHSFRRISHDKKFYTIANLIKAGILVSLVPFATFHLIHIILFDEWDTNTLQNLGCIYTIPDFVSMIVVKRMSWSTWTHHLCVLLFNFFSITNDYQKENICRCLVVYAAFSTFAYCVNVLLASRFLGVPPNVARVLSFIAVVVYILCCATNWTWQVYYLSKLLRGGHDHWTVYAYMFLICLVMYDDVTLNKWLLHNAKSTAFAAAQYQQQQRRKQKKQ